MRTEFDWFRVGFTAGFVNNTPLNPIKNGSFLD
jgi:hypothetical protein